MNLNFTLPSHLFEIYVQLFFFLCLIFSAALLPVGFPPKTPCRQSDMHLMPLRMTVSVLYGAVQDSVSQIISLSGSISLFVEICRAPWTEDQPVEMLLSIRNNRGTKYKSI